MYGNPYYQPEVQGSTDELEHYGVRGMKWGVRRYQNADGTLTDAGKRHARQYATLANNYAWKAAKYDRKAERRMEKAYQKTDNPKLITRLLSQRDQDLASDYRRQAQQILDAFYPEMRDIPWSSVEKKEVYLDAMHWKTPKWARD